MPFVSFRPGICVCFLSGPGRLRGRAGAGPAGDSAISTTAIRGDATMKTLFGMCGALVLGWAIAANGATITVDIDADEANCNQGADNTKPCYIDTATADNPLSTGCSLREALQDIADVAG